MTINPKPAFAGIRRPRRGSTLILAIWTLFLLTTFAVQLGYIIRQKITLVRRIENRDIRFRIAEAGVNYAISRLRTPDSFITADYMTEQWCDQESLFKERPVGRGRFTISYDLYDGDQSRTMYGMEDEERKLNLNHAEASEITRLLQNIAELSHSEAEELAYNIIDWRDNDSFFEHPQYGAEDSDYRGQRYSHESKDADYEVLEELMLVKKMEQEVFDKIKHFVTIYGDGRVNINTAPKEVLLALGVQDYVADRILEFRRGSDGVAGTGDDDVFLQTSTIVSRLSQAFDLSPSELGSLSNLVAGGKFTVKSDNFMIQSQATLNRIKGETTVVAVADRTGKIKYWREET